MMHYHQYEYRDAGPHSNEVVRDRLRKRPQKTFATVDEAVTWYTKYLAETQRAPGYWAERGEAEYKADKVEFMRSQLECSNNVMDGFWSGQQFIGLTLLPCPAREIPGMPAPPPCPTGHS